MSQIKAVLFDLDGTLTNTLDDLANAGNHTLAALGYPVHEVHRYRYFVGRGIPNLIESILPPEARTQQVKATALKAFFDYYNVHYKDLTAPYDGILPLLARLREGGVKLAVVTNKADANARRIVTEFFPATFDEVCGQRDGLPVKPDPAGARLIMQRLGVQPDECLFVGDSGVDMQTGVNCGAHPVGVLWGFRDRDELVGCGARYIIERPEQLIDLVFDFGGTGIAK
jgi:phosphoglycolate phosphatase